MSPAALARAPLALLPALGGALLMLGVLGPNLRGAAAATLAAAGGLALTLRSRGEAPAVLPAVRILERACSSAHATRWCWWRRPGAATSSATGATVT